MKKVITIIVLVALGIYGFTTLESNEKKDKGLATLSSDHIAIGVTDFEESVTWYKEVLGFREELRWEVDGLDGLNFAYLMTDNYRIEIIGNKNVTNTNAGPETFGDHLSQQGYVHLAFEVEDIDLAFKQLEEKGQTIFIQPFTAPMHTTHERRIAFIKDPSGNVIEFAGTFHQLKNKKQK